MKVTSRARLMVAGWPLWAGLLVMLSTYGCSRPGSIPIDQSSTPQHQTPFQDVDEGKNGAPLSHPQSIKLIATPAIGKPARLTPAVRPQNLPDGTLLTVRLKAPVYASTSASESWFEAMVVEPVVVEGNTLIPAGASVAGRVESARTSNVKPNRGYVRLALQSLQLGEVRVPVQSASLFAREAPLSEDPIAVIHLEKGRRLTFRLTGAVSTSNQRAQATP